MQLNSCTFIKSLTKEGEVKMDDFEKLEFGILGILTLVTLYFVMSDSKFNKK
jgi:hypothetical protein